MSVNVGDIEATLRLRDELTPALDHAQQSLKQFGGQLKDIGSIANASAQALLPLSAAIATVAGVSVKFAADFESSMTKVVTIAGETADNLGTMKKAVLDLAPTVGIGPRALADALLVVESTGIHGAAALDILKASAKASANGLGETKDIARAVTAAVNAYGAQNLSAAEATDVLFAAVREGGAEATEFAGTLGRVVGIASQVGVSFSEVSSFVAGFTRLGVGADEAVTALRGTLSTILHPSAQARDALAGLGISVDDLRKAVKDKGLTVAMQELITATHGNFDAIGEIIPNVRALAGVLGTAGSQATAMRDILDKVTHSAGDNARAFEVTAKTAAQQWKELTAQAEALAIEFGTALLPIAKDVLDFFKKLEPLVKNAIQGFKDLPKPLQEAAVAFGGLLVVAPAVLFFVGSLATSLGTIVTLLPKVAPLLTAGAGGATGGGVGALAGIAGLGSLAFAGATAGFYAANQQKNAFIQGRYGPQTQQLGSQDFSGLNQLLGVTLDLSGANTPPPPASGSRLGGGTIPLTKEQQAALAKSEQRRKDDRAFIANLLAKRANLADLPGDIKGGLPGYADRAWLDQQILNQTLFEAFNDNDQQDRLDFNKRVITRGIPYGISFGLPGSIGGVGGLKKPPAGITQDLFGLSNSQLGLQVSATALQAVTGGGSVGGSIGGLLAGKVAGKLAAGSIGKIAGGALGSVLPGIGTILGSIGGELLGKLFGPGEGAKSNDLRDALKQQLGGDASGAGLQALVGGAQSSGAGLGLGFNNQLQSSYQQFLGAGKEKDVQKAADALKAALDAQNKAISEAQARLDKYGLSLDDLKTPYDNASKALQTFTADYEALKKTGFSDDQIGKAMETSLVSLINQLLRAGNDIPSTLGKVIDSVAKNWQDLLDRGGKGAEGTKQQLNELLRTALDTGRKLPDAFGPLLETLVKTGGVADDVAYRLLGINPPDVAPWHDMQAAAEEFGISLDQLGPRFQQSKLTDSAKDLAEKWALLVDNGANVDAVIHGMSDRANEFVHSALKFGLEVPASMKPMLEAMQKAGTLTDDAGEKLDDLSGLKFASDPAKQFDDLIKKIGELIDKLSGPNGLGNALNNLPSPNVDVNVNYRYGQPHGPDEGTGDQETPQTAAIGGYFPAKSGGTLVRLAEGGQGEYVVPQSVMAGMRGGGGATVVVNIYANNSIMGAPNRQMARQLSELITPELSRSILDRVAG